MHFYLMPILATIVRLAAAQDGRTLVTGLTNTIAVSNGGIGGTAVCKVAGTLDRGNQPIGFAAQRTCDKIQNDGIFKATPIKFDSNPDLSLLVSCNVKPGDCGTFLDLRVETTDGYCNQGRTYRIDCPETDFRKGSSGDLDPRQEAPINSQKQCYADILLVECFE